MPFKWRPAGKPEETRGWGEGVNIGLVIIGVIFCQGFLEIDEKKK